MERADNVKLLSEEIRKKCLADFDREVLQGTLAAISKKRKIPVA